MEPFFDRQRSTNASKSWITSAVRQAPANQPPPLPTPAPISSLDLPLRTRPRRSNQPNVLGMKRIFPEQENATIDQHRIIVENVFGWQQKASVFAKASFETALLCTRVWARGGKKERLFIEKDRKSTRLNSSHRNTSRMPSSA